jgi:hypothetical protein
MLRSPEFHDYTDRLSALLFDGPAQDAGSSAELDGDS